MHSEAFVLALANLMVLDQLAKPRRDARVVQTRRRKLLARRPPQ